MLTSLLAVSLGVVPQDVDVFFSSRLERAPLDSLAAAVTHVEPRLGVPTVAWSIRVGPNAPAWAHADLTPAEAARRYLLELASLYRLTAEDVARLELRHTFDLGRGALVVTFGRRLDGVPLFRDEVHVVMTRARELIAVTGNVNPATPDGRASQQFRLTATTAARQATLDVGLEVGELFVTSERDGWLRLRSDRLAVRALRARRVWYGLPDTLEAAWEIETDDGDTAVAHVVSAWNGRLLSRRSLTADASFKVFAQPTAPFTPDDSPFGVALSPHPTGVRLPSFEGSWASASLVTLDAAPYGRMDPWLPAGATTLQGNNAFAFVDLFAPYGLNSDAGLPDGGTRPQDQLVPMTAPGVFDHPWDPDGGLTAGAQANAATTHLFFTVNWLHDWLSASGFDEAAGNGQEDNFGRGGKAGDRLDVTAFSFARPNNASMSTLADGERSRMQMGNFSGTQLRYLELQGLDAGRRLVNLALGGPAQVSLTAPPVLLQSDAGFNGCDELFDPAAVSGRVAFALDRGCAARSSLERARDAGAAALVIISSNAGFPNLFMPDASIDLPVVGIPGASGDVLAAFDGGVPFSPTIVVRQLAGRASALDTQVATHEFGHFVSNRLISDTAGLQLQISRSMGEGWSDFLALLQTVRAADAQLASNASWSGSYAVGAYSVSGVDPLGAPLEHQWFGIRRAPYSTDLAKNGLSFRHIRDGAALPSGAFPNGVANSEVHNAGEVWCTMLWEAFVAHLRASPDFERARTQMLETLIASFKATPVNPDFLEARDAMLAVAFATDPAYFRTLYGGFTRRGAGPRAEAPPKLATNNAPVVEDTSMADGVKVTAAGLDDSVAWCDKDGRLDVGERGVLTLTARNIGFSAQSAPQVMQVRAVSPGVVVEGDGLVTFAASAPFAVVRGSVPVRLDRATDARMLEFRVETVGQTPASTMLVSTLANFDLIPSSTEDFEAPLALDRGMGWRRGDDLEANDYLAEQKWNISPQTPTQTVMNGPNATARGRSWLITPPLPVGSGPLTFRFRHRYQLENSANTAWDGAMLELSEDGQQTWTQVPSSSLAPGYSGTISTTQPNGSPLNNPAAGSPAFVGRSVSYPNFVNQVVSLGTAYAGKTIHLRFVIATDPNGGGAGWDIDDVEVVGLTTTPFTQRVADRGQCVNRAPLVEAGLRRSVKEKTQVKLEAQVSDPDMDPVTVTWAQVGGPTVGLTGDTFTAPDVTSPTELEFEITVKDAALETKDRLQLVVEPVNTPPRVMVAGPSLVRGGETFTITATTADDDGDTVQVTFVQTRGPLAKDLGNGKFQAPQVKEPDRMYFDVIASDGAATATAQLETGMEPSACGCSSSPINAVWIVALLALTRRRRREQLGFDP